MHRIKTIGLFGFIAVGMLISTISLQTSMARKRSNVKSRNASGASTIVLKNGDMSLGADIPGFWHHQWVGKGKINVSRDTQVFKHGPAALKVSTADGPAKGQASQLIKGNPGQSFVLSGFAKSKGRVKVNVAVQSFSKETKPIKFQQVQYLQDTQNWTSFSQEVTLPKGTHRFGIVLLVEGQGHAWLDEVKLTGTTVKNIGGDPTNLPPPKKQDPTVAMQGYFPKYPQAWLKFHEQHLQLTRKRQINVAFLGDSITQDWKKHKSLWRQHYGKYGAANFGIGGDRTQQILWRIDQGLFDHMQPQVVVLNIGVNNLLGNPSEANRIAAGIEKIVATIRDKSPQTKILLLGIFPTGQQPNTPIRKKIQAINTRLAKLDNGKSIYFLDIGSEFLATDGSIKKKMMPDYLHLSRQGYQIWVNSMRRQFTEILN